MERYYEHCYDATRNGERAIHRAIQKYGPSKTLVQTLLVSNDWDALKNIECGLIKAMRTFGDGYNMTRGGDGALGYKHTSESLLKMGATHKGNKYRVGMNHSPDARRKMSSSHLGKKLTDTHRANIGLALKGNSYCLGFKHSEETCRKRVIVARGTSKSTATIGLVGVSIDRQTNRYRATITVASKTIHLGRFGTIQEAQAARLKAEIHYFGDPS